ncbi:hypothetical protein RUND412_006059 [Rhizina undulata]
MSKKLSYEMKEPAFLRRMRQQQGGSGAQERYIAPRNKKAPVDNDEDAPAYVLEGHETETISRAEFEAMAAGRDLKAEEQEGSGSEGAEGAKKDDDADAEKAPDAEVEDAEAIDSKRTTRENVTEVGTQSKKRKVAKIIAGDDEDSAEQGKASEPTKGKGKQQVGGKQKRRVKLSFGDDE